MSGGARILQNCAYTSQNVGKQISSDIILSVCERQPLSVRSVCNVFIFECSYKLDCQSQ